MRLKLLTLAMALSAVSLPGHGEDLMDAYRQARANDPVLAQVDAQRLSSNESVPQARALLLPQVSASLDLSQRSGNGGSTTGFNNGTGTGTGTGTIGDTFDGNLGHIRSRSITGQVNQAVFDLSAIATLRAAHSSANQQDAIYTAALQNLFVRVSQAYLNVLTLQDQLSYAKANEDAFRQTYEQAQNKFDVGLSAVTDAYQAKSQYELAKSQTLVAENSLNDAIEGLRQITGKPVANLKKLRDDLPLNPPSPNNADAWVQAATRSNPNIIAAQYGVESAGHSVNAARAGHLPTISASLQRGKSTIWYKNGPSSDELRADNGRYGNTLGLTLNVPIFEGGATQSKVRQAIYNRDADQDQLEIERRQTIRDALNYYRSVLSGISQVQANKASVESAQKALDATKAGYNVGTETLLDVLTAIQTLTQAESSYSSSRHTLVLTQLQLKQAAGDIGVKDIEGVNALLVE